MYTDAALTWKNCRYNTEEIETISIPIGLQAVNAPLYIYPEVAKEASKWMKIEGRRERKKEVH
jgi:hypothetical protein